MYYQLTINVPRCGVSDVHVDRRHVDMLKSLSRCTAVTVCTLVRAVGCTSSWQLQCGLRSLFWLKCLWFSIIYCKSSIFPHCYKTNSQLSVCSFHFTSLWSGHSLVSDSGNSVCTVARILQHSSYWRHVSWSFGRASVELHLKMHSALTASCVGRHLQTFLRVVDMFCITG